MIDKLNTLITQVNAEFDEQALPLSREISRLEHEDAIAQRAQEVQEQGKDRHKTIPRGNAKRTKHATQNLGLTDEEMEHFNELRHKAGGG